MVVCGALVVAPGSSVYTPQELAGKLVALDYGNGTAYAGLLMLEGAMPRQAITTRAADQNACRRYLELMRGEFEATVLQEPWITIAQKAGCRLVSTTFFHGTWVADGSVTPETYAAFLRATTRAVRRVNADKRRYLHYFIQAARTSAAAAGAPDLPEVNDLCIEDFDLGRIQLKEPGPIPVEEARWAWEWMAGWGLLDGSFEPEEQINSDLERQARDLAAAVG